MSFILTGANDDGELQKFIKDTAPAAFVMYSFLRQDGMRDVKILGQDEVE